MSPPNPIQPRRKPDAITRGRRRIAGGQPRPRRARPPTSERTATRRAANRRPEDRPPVRRIRPDVRNPRVRFDRLERLLGGRQAGPSASASETASVDQQGGRSDGSPPVHWSELCAPLVLSAGYGLLATVVGSNPVDATAPAWSRAVAAGLLGTLLLVAGWTTGRLYDDARWWHARPTTWNPNPIAYVLVGTLVTALAYVAIPLAFGGTIDRLGRYVAGASLAALAFSSIVSGPLYALQRRRRVAE